MMRDLAFFFISSFSKLYKLDLIFSLGYHIHGSASRRIGPTYLDQIRGAEVVWNRDISTRLSIARIEDFSNTIVNSLSIVI